MLKHRCNLANGQTSSLHCERDEIRNFPLSQCSLLRLQCLSCVILKLLSRTIILMIALTLKSSLLQVYQFSYQDSKIVSLLVNQYHKRHYQVRPVYFGSFPQPWSFCNFLSLINGNSFKKKKHSVVLVLIIHLLCQFKRFI